MGIGRAKEELDDCSMRVNCLQGTEQEEPEKVAWKEGPGREDKQEVW